MIAKMIILKLSDSHYISWADGGLGKGLGLDEGRAGC
jgi:hypothetical protein